MTLSTPTLDPASMRRSLQVEGLEHALGQVLGLWLLHDEDWECVSESCEGNVDSGAFTDVFERATRAQKPQMLDVDPETILLVLPCAIPGIQEGSVLTARIEPKVAELAMFACEQYLLSGHRGSELEFLREENQAFLQQVSEDFEELTFLRSMAEHLTLEESNSNLNQVTTFSLSLLGQIAGVEYLYFLDWQKGKPRVASEWSAEPDQLPRLDPRQIEAFVAELDEQSDNRPLVRNAISGFEFREHLANIREVILIPVSTAQARIGWLFAVNRSSQQLDFDNDSPWKLSQNELGSRETSLLTTAAAMLASHANNLTLLEEREQLLINVVRALVSAIDSRDPYTCGHSERVALYAKRLGAEIGLDETACEQLYLTGLLHDLGKIGISDSVLKKNGPLSEEEYAEIKRHPELGWSILRGLEQFDYVLPGVLHHHERYDGKGYPDQLQGDSTPLEGRLLAVVDAFDAMTSNRTYRDGMPIEKAIDILAEGAGTQWDAKLVDAFLRALPDIREIRANYSRPPMSNRLEYQRAQQLSN